MLADSVLNENDNSQDEKVVSCGLNDANSPS